MILRLEKLSIFPSLSPQTIMSSRGNTNPAPSESGAGAQSGPHTFTNADLATPSTNAPNNPTNSTANADADGVPDDPPPPYTEVADGTTEVSADANFQRPFVALNQHAATPQAAPPPGPPPPQQHYFPPAGPPPMPTRPPAMPPRPNNNSGSSMLYPSSSNSSVGSGKASRVNSSSTYPGARQNTYGGAGASGAGFPPPPPGPPPPQRQQYGAPLQQRAQVPWVYPPGYWCPKCNNTGIKLKNGLSCQDCYGRFAHQHANIYQTPGSGGSYLAPVPMQPRQPMMAGRKVSHLGPSPVVVQPGDPRIGGMLCGRCRGRGLIWDFLSETTCPTCRGVGRLF